MTVKYLNLDDLATAPNRFLKLQGVEHAIIEQTVEGFIEATKLVKDLQVKSEDDIASQVELTVALIVLAVPTIDASALRLMPLSSLGKIAAFVRGIDEEAEAIAAEGESEKK